MKAKLMYDTISYNLLGFALLIVAAFSVAVYFFGQVPEWYYFYHTMGIVSIVAVVLASAMFGIAYGIRLVEKHGLH